MSKLYTKDIIEKQRQKIKKIKNKINACERLSQQEIIEYINLNAYNFHYNDDEMKNIIESWIASFSHFLEPTENALISSFPGQYIQRIFELAMANLISKKFSLVIKNQEDVDLIMMHFNQKYYFECATRVPSQMDKFYELLPDFDQYHKVAETFKNKHNELIQKNLLINTVCYLDIITPLIWNEMNNDEKLKIKEILNPLGISTEENIISKINDWIYFNGYACLYFRDFIPEDLWEKYKNIDFPINSLPGRSNQINDCIFAIDRIVEKIIDKLKKQYFDENLPVVLAISIATFPEIIPVAPISFFIETIIDHLPWKLTQAINQNPNSEKLENNAKNLFAILIDTTWYNWFPSVAQRKHNASFPIGIDNHYAVVYNEHCSHMSQDHIKKIFDDLVSITVTLPLSVQNNCESIIDCLTEG